MAGAYIHIPFCKQACNYCNFFFSTSVNQKADYISALFKEIELHKDWPYKELDTLYFGGGTPSLFAPDQLKRIIYLVDKYHKLKHNAEITLEANPDDLSIGYLQQLKKTGINRLSIGIQSFINRDLELMNRAHTAFQALNCIKDANFAGFKNITIDLIYGTPGLSNKEWKRNIELSVNSGVNHISAYCLTVEDNTKLFHDIRKGNVPNVDEEKSSIQYEILMDLLPEYGFEQYEISNFCRPGYRSKHNSSYWRNQPYLGLGPSAHSFDLTYRYKNVANIQKYCEMISNGQLPWDSEKINKVQRANEMILTQIRTSEGIDVVSFIKKFGKTLADSVVTKAMDLGSDFLDIEDGQIYLTKKGRLLADHITVKLMI